MKVLQLAAALPFIVAGCASPSTPSVWRVHPVADYVPDATYAGLTFDELLAEHSKLLEEYYIARGVSARDQANIDVTSAMLGPGGITPQAEFYARLRSVAGHALAVEKAIFEADPDYPLVTIQDTLDERYRLYRESARDDSNF